MTSPRTTVQFRRSLLAVIVTLAALLPAGCAPAADISEIVRPVRGEFREAGFEDSGVHLRKYWFQNGPDEDRALVVVLGSSMDDTIARDTVADIVWTKLPIRFDRLLIEYEGRFTDHTYSDLEEEYGPRPADLDNRSMDEVIGFQFPDLTATPVLGALLALLSFGLIVLAVIVIVRRRGASRPRPR